jgi:hypothetical protein
MFLHEKQIHVTHHPENDHEIFMKFNKKVVRGIIYKGESKNFLLISVNNLKQRD